MQHKKRPKVVLHKNSNNYKSKNKAPAIDISYKISANAGKKNDSEDEVSKNFYTLFKNRNKRDSRSDNDLNLEMIYLRTSDEDGCKQSSTV